VLREISPARIFARPTADDVWLGPARESALRQLSAPHPVRVLAGPRSSGRTSLLRHWESVSHADAAFLRVQGPQRIRENLLQALADSVGLATARQDCEDLRRQLDSHIRRSRQSGRRLILVIDDADEIGPLALDEILRLTRPDHGDAGIPELLLVLADTGRDRSPAAGFASSCRASAHIGLSWLDPTEVGLYLRWRTERFGLGAVFSDAATALIAARTHGCFSAVDHVGQLALLLLRNGRSDHVDTLLAGEAIRILQRQSGQREPRAERAAAAEVVVTRDGKLRHQRAIGDTLLVGRGPLNDLSLDSSRLSLHHAAFIRARSGGYYVSDLNSANGVWLNGRRVQSAPVANGDVITLGPYSVKLVVPGDLPGQADMEQIDELAETAVMPAPDFPEPALLKRIR